MFDTQFHPDRFDITDLDDEIRVDRLCGELLRTFAAATVAAGSTPLEAGTLARNADYFLRDFVIAERRENIFRLPPRRIAQFAGNWYIVRNLEPNLSELAAILGGVEAFYRFCATKGLLDEERVAAIAAQCRELERYRERIATFWEITDDGFFAWNEQCPLTER